MRGGQILLSKAQTIHRNYECVCFIFKLYFWLDKNMILNMQKWDKHKCQICIVSLLYLWCPNIKPCNKLINFVCFIVLGLIQCHDLLCMIPIGLIYWQENAWRWKCSWYNFQLIWILPDLNISFGFLLLISIHLTPSSNIPGHPGTECLRQVGSLLVPSPPPPSVTRAEKSLPSPPPPSVSRAEKSRPGGTFFSTAKKTAKEGKVRAKYLVSLA